MTSKKQQTLSAFFQKPQLGSPGSTKHHSTADIELDLPVSKRRKIAENGACNSTRPLSTEAPNGNNTRLQPLSLNEQNTRVSHEQIPITQRTSQYVFSPDVAVEDTPTSAQQNPAKQDLHKRFLRKLGRPDSINDIKRRNGALLEEQDGQDEEEGEDEDVDLELQKLVNRRSKKSSTTLTPMEKQIIEIKMAHEDTLLVVEVGYKFKFFGEDARHAARELGIVCIPGKMRFDSHPSEAHLDRFASASIPVHRLHVHVKRLVAAGYKVGVVRQLETAALKAAGDNRNTPFTRKLTNLYTKGTYIDEMSGLSIDTDVESKQETYSSGFILCLTESNTNGPANDDKVNIGIVAVQPATGELVHDNFDDGFLRGDIETRLLHIAPVEFLIVGNLSRATEKLIIHLSGSRTNIFADKARVERVGRSKTAAVQAHNHVVQFYTNKLKAQNKDQTAMLNRILALPEQVMICLSSLIKHLADFGLDNVFDLTRYFRPFSASSHMLLNGNTLNSLEIYQNQTDHTIKGSLFWTLDRTKTRFGSRLLRKWVGRPLLDRTEIETRLEAVGELADPEKSVPTSKLRSVLNRIKADLEKTLLRVYYGKCTRPELVQLLQVFQSVGHEYADVTDRAGFSSSILISALDNLPTLQSEVTSYLSKVNLHAAKVDDKYDFFRDEHETDDITEHKLGIASVEHDLDSFRRTAADILGWKRPVEYAIVAGIDYLIEVDNSGPAIKKVPASWVKISGTKKSSRFHPPEVVKLVRERDQHKEALSSACDSAYQDYQKDVSARYQGFRDAILSLATLDCLMSLAAIAQQPGYTKPQFTNEAQIQLRGARHPMIEQLLIDAYVPNNISLVEDTTRSLLITGPNMGGKSSYVRSVALITIMAQIGSFVPADAAQLGVVDAVFTRMGAFDNMMAGESTFMVELSETSDILKLATNKSLVILDELGRGTSTHDGVAIAGSVLDWLVRDKKCFTLFITHYQVLARMAENFHGELKNVHMKFSEDEKGGDNVTFLYEVGDGMAHRSYGLNVARLAGLDASVISLARDKSSELEEKLKRRKLQAISELLGARDQGRSNGDELHALVEAIDVL